jgi:hypothetical protein
MAVHIAFGHSLSTPHHTLAPISDKIQAILYFFVPVHRYDEVVRGSDPRQSGFESAIIDLPDWLRWVRKLELERVRLAPKSVGREPRWHTN